MTAPVKRYNMDVGKFGNVDAYESEHGRWVKRDDYERLEQECERLRSDFRCPRPCNGRPEHFTSSQCLEAGECGCMPAGELIRGLMAEVEAVRAAFVKMRNAAAGYSNYCEESASTRRLDRELEVADQLYCQTNTALQAKP